MGRFPFCRQNQVEFCPEILCFSCQPQLPSSEPVDGFSAYMGHVLGKGGLLPIFAETGSMTACQVNKTNKSFGEVCDLFFEPRGFGWFKKEINLVDTSPFCLAIPN